MLQAFDRKFVDPAQGEAVTGSGLFQLVGRDFAGLEQAQDFLGGLLDFLVQSIRRGHRP